MVTVGQIRVLGTECRRMPLRNPGTGDVLVDREGREGFLELRHWIGAEARGLQLLYKKTNDGGDAPTPEEIEADAIVGMAEITQGWHLVGLDGAALDIQCTWATAQDVYRDEGMCWIRRQVEKFASDAGNWLSDLKVAAPRGSVNLSAGAARPSACSAQIECRGDKIVVVLDAAEVVKAYLRGQA
jgi:hypothetical protein